MSIRAYLLPTALLLVLAARVAAHEHHEELTEEEANAPVDTVLWMHIVLQAGVWGVLFPTGMVLGLTKSRWHVPLQVRTPSHTSSARTYFKHTEYGYCPHAWRLHPWTLAWWASLSPWGARRHGQHRALAHPPSAGARRVPQASHTRRDYPTMGCEGAWNCWQSVPDYWMDADVVRCDRLQGILSRW